MGAEKGNVETTQGEVVSSIDDALQWPSGRQILDLLASQGIHNAKQNDNNSISDKADEQRASEVYWQTSAQWALLEKYGLLPASLTDRYKVVDGWKRQLEFSDDDVQSIQQAWQELLVSSSNPKTNNSSSSELKEFLTTSRSNGKELQWSFLHCGPACQFKLHAHANIELIYCATGVLYEIRMDGSPIEIERSSQKEGTCPSLSSLQRKWSFHTLYQGEWLVNEVGSIHKSFTATKGEGCVLLVLWSGSHYDVVEGEEPQSVNVEEAVNQMDDRLSACSDCSKWTTLQETFLPDSERTG